MRPLRSWTFGRWRARRSRMAARFAAVVLVRTARSSSRKARARSTVPACRAAPSPANAVRLQLRALACNLGNFMRKLAMPQTAEPWSLKPAREADQDRHQGRQPWAVRYVSDGRSRGAAADVPGDPVADRRLRAPARFRRGSLPGFLPRS